MKPSPISLPCPSRQPTPIRALWLGLTLFCMAAADSRSADSGVLAIPAAEAKALERGRALAAATRSQRPAESNVTTGTLRLRHPDGRRVVVPLEVKVDVGTNEVWSTTYKASFPDGRRESLRVVNPTAGPPHFILHRSTGGGNITESRPTRPDEQFAAFAGTDFSFIDLGLVFLHWPDQRWTGREIRRTRTCNILESRNPFVGLGGYLRVVTWLDEETGGIVRAEAYDAKNRLLKEFSPGSFARVGSRYELRDMEIRNEQSDSRTTIQFDIENPEKLGVPQLPAEK